MQEETRQLRAGICRGWCWGKCNAGGPRHRGLAWNKKNSLSSDLIERGGRWVWANMGGSITQQIEGVGRCEKDGRMEGGGCERDGRMEGWAGVRGMQTVNQQTIKCH